jgi:hypothetical protein
MKKARLENDDNNKSGGTEFEAGKIPFAHIYNNCLLLVIIK